MCYGITRLNGFGCRRVFAQLQKKKTPPFLSRVYKTRVSKADFEKSKRITTPPYTHTHTICCQRRRCRLFVLRTAVEKNEEKKKVARKAYTTSSSSSLAPPHLTNKHVTATRTSAAVSRLRRAQSLPDDLSPALAYARRKHRARASAAAE